MRKTKNTPRHYTCKCCGAEIKEILRNRKKPRKYKDICLLCIDRRMEVDKPRTERQADFTKNARCGSLPF